MGSIQLSEVTKTFPKSKAAAVDHVSLEIADGEFLVLVGPSGCGKSTLLRMIAGIETITTGRILIDGADATHALPKERDIAMVFQNYALYPHMSVAENMGFALKIAGVAKDERAERVLEAARMLGLEDYLDRKPKALSGGQRQRVAMGRAIARQPQVFLMDEPLSNLDAKLRVQTRTQIASLQHRLGTTTVYVTHDQTEAMTMGDRIVVMKEGVIQQVGTPRDLYEQPQNAFVAGFIGSPAMNMWQEDGLTVGVRPEDLEVAPAGEGIPVVVDVVEELGADGYLYGRATVEDREFDIVVRVDGRDHPEARETISVKPVAARVHRFDEQGERVAAVPAA